jgi:tyrosyl-tRNA synthetase
MMRTQIENGIADVFPEIDLQEFLSTPKRIKIGFDPTTDFLHLGHAVLLRKLKQFQENGHIPVIIIGDFTARIGDPTGKSETRKQLSKIEIDNNIQNFIKALNLFIDCEKAEIVFNSQHLEKLNLSDLIELQSIVTVSQLLAKKDFHQRFLNQVPISLHEFIYPLLQGFDSHAISSDIEIGGMDQKFNVSMGREIQRHFQNKTQQIGMLMPILSGTDGFQKMSKSLNNAIKIDEHPLLMFSQLEKIPDHLIDDYITLLTDCDLGSFSTDPREKQKQMALEVVSEFYGKSVALQAMSESQKIVSSNANIENVPEINLSHLKFPMNFAVLLREIGLSESSSAARRYIHSGSVKLNGQKIMDEDLIVSGDDLNGKILQMSKKSFHRLIV